MTHQYAHTAWPTQESLLPAQAHNVPSKTAQLATVVWNQLACVSSCSWLLWWKSESLLQLRHSQQHMGYFAKAVTYTKGRELVGLRFDGNPRGM